MGLSKTLSWLLRHGAREKGLAVSDDGYVCMRQMLALDIFEGITEQDVRRIVATNEKQRFSIKDTGDSCYIRATQGHSFNVDPEKLLTRVTDPSLITPCIHGTTSRHLDSIMKHGLCRIKRQHIHCCSGEGAKSGMRSNSDVLIYIDVRKAMEHCPFFLSENGVILTPGVDGVILPEWFEKVRRLG
jgi:2'-phosphotransferase